jgi:hypothetical protein
MTGNLWFWIPDEHGLPRLDEKGKPIMRRGQFLPWVCTRSQFILTAPLIPETGFDSINIVRGISHVHDDYGLVKNLYLENGIWRSKLITGTVEGRGPWADYVVGLAGVGINVRHARPGNPRAKIVENIFAQLQNKMDRLRGYAGRKPEQCPEDTLRHLKLVASGEAHPGEFFMSYPETVRKYEEVCNAFNHEPQNGAMLDGLSPIEAFVKFRKSPPIFLPPELRYLLARCRVETTVKANGIRIGKFWYKGERTSALVHERVLAWFNPEDPESICVTDLNQKNPFTVSRAASVPAFDASPEEIAQAERENYAQTKYQRTLYRKLVHDFPEEFQRRRRNIVLAPAETAALGVEMETQRLENNKAAVKAEALREKGNRLARDVGLPGIGRRASEEKIEALDALARRNIRAENPYADVP